MKYKEFGEINEQSILDNCPRVIGDVKKEFGLAFDKDFSNEIENLDNSSSTTSSRGFSRVLTMDNSSFSKPVIDDKPYSDNSYNMGGYSISGDIKKTSGASYVLVVAAIVALVAIVYIVTTTILGMMDGLV